jgi:hypothetical protein
MAKQKKANGFRMEIGLPEGQQWSAKDLETIKAHAKEIAAKRTPEQRMKNEMAAIRFRMEQYANTEESKIAREQTI